MESSSFPQFSSFGSSNEKLPRSDDKDLSRKPRDGRKKSRDRPKHHRHHHSHSSSRESKSRAEAEAFLESISSSLHQRAPVSDLFEYDLIGDENNFKYGKPYKRSIPKYYRYTSRVLGLPRDMRIIFSKSDLENSDVVIKKVTKSTEHDRRILWNSNRSLIEKYPVKFLNSSGNDMGDLSDNDFIYEIDEKKDLELFANEYLQKLLRARADIYNELDVDPKNIDLWFRVLECEESILRYSKSTKANASEVIESILSKALKANRGNGRLIRKYMLIQRSVLNPSSKWRDLVVDYPNIVQYWLSWIESMLENAVGTVLEVVGYVVQRQGIFDLLDSKYRNNQLSIELMEEIYTRIVHKICKFLFQAGYPEMGIGIYQGLIEVNFFSPLESEGEIDILLKSFKQYWNMETAHIGDKGAVGWLNTKMETPVLKGSASPFPARTIDLVDETEDVDEFISRIVLFRDIQPFMRVVNRAKSNILWGLMDLVSASKLTWRWLSEEVILSAVREKDVHQESKDLFCARVIIQVIKQLANQSKCDLIGNEFWEWSLEFMFDFDKKQFDRISKWLLSFDENNIVLWTRYACIQFKSNPQLARTIFEKSLVAKSDLDSLLNCWNNWVIKELETDGDLTKVIELSKLPAFQSLSKDSTQSTAIATLLSSYITCNNYILEGNVLNESLKEFWIQTKHTTIKPFTNHAVLTVLKHHKRNNPLAHSSIIQHFITTSVLQRSDESYPDADLFLALAEVENQYGNNTTISISAFGSKNNKINQILWLLHGLEKKPNIYSTRALYEQAISDSEVRKCSIVWEMYYNFELNSAIDHNRARSVLVRAVEHCGWSSNLYSKCFESPIENLIGPISLDHIKKIIDERSIRLRN